MKQHRGIWVDLPNKRIIMKKEFACKVVDFNSMEHAEFMQLRATYPTFEVAKYTISQSPNREKYDKLSYKNMGELIAEWEKGNVAALEELEQKKHEAKCCAGSYGIVKKWFLGKYGARYAALKNKKTAN